MSTTNIVLRSTLSALLLFVYFVWNKLIESYVSVQSGPSMMFSEGIEQRFGQDVLHWLTILIGLATVAIVGLVMLPVAQHVYRKVSESKEDTNETA